MSCLPRTQRVHELSLCDDLLSQVLALATSHQAQAVTSVTVQLGVLSGVEALLLANAFAIMKIGTVAEQADFIIDTIPVTIACGDCSTHAETAANCLVCPSCASHNTSLVQGDELILASVALACLD